MNEFACQLGVHGRLAGIVTEPEQGRAKAACVLVSAGLVPKSGPYRLYTLIARRLCEAGFLTLRFDLGGIGDSRPEHEGLPLKERTALEIRAAVDFLAQRYGIGHIALCGLCSGAEDSFRYAEQDVRVGGVIMIDPFSYKTAGWGWRHFFHRIARRSLRILGIYTPPAYTMASGAALSGDGGTLIKYKYLEPAESRRILRALLARNARMHFIYTGGVRETFNHAGQLQKMFPDIDLARGVTLDHLPGMEHIQLLEEDRKAVVEAIHHWFVTHYAPLAGAP